MFKTAKRTNRARRLVRAKMYCTTAVPQDKGLSSCHTISTKPDPIGLSQLYSTQICYQCELPLKAMNTIQLVSGMGGLITDESSGWLETVKTVISPTENKCCATIGRS